MTWTKFKTAELISRGVLEIGDGYRAKNSEMAEEGIPFIRAGDVVGRVNTDGTDLLAFESVGKAGRKRSLAGDVVITTKGTIGRLAFVKEGDPEFIYSPQLCFWRSLDSELIDPRWLYFAMRSREMLNQISWSAGQTDMAPYVSLTDQRTAFEITLPTIHEQRDIAAILGALDDKIELNRKTAATLEEMARALYRSWFVDFDPVWAKVEGREPAHMVAETAALFPDSFGEDGLPEGWSPEPLSQHLTVHRGLSYKGKHLCEEGEGVPLHNLNSIFEGGGYKDAGIKYYNGDFKQRHEIRPGDLVVANTEQSFGLDLIGHSALVPHWLGPTGLFSQHLYKVEPKTGSPVTKEWLYFMLAVSPSGSAIRRYSNGTTVNMLPSDALELPEVPIPSSEILTRFTEIVAPMIERQESLRVEARSLSSLRDALLPKLMSGELRVGKAMKQMEDVA